MNPLRWIAAVLALVVVGVPVQAQPAADLIDRVPEGYALCVVMNDLRDNWQRWQKQEWFAKAADSPLGKAILDTPEIRNLKKIENDLQTVFNINGAVLRDDLLGDQAIFAFKPAFDGEADQEDGLFLVRARGSDAWQRLFDRLNEIQKENGELKSLEERKHQGQSYWKRSMKTDQFVAIEGAVLAVGNKEASIKAFLDRKTNGPSALSRSLKKVGRPFLAMWVNPRVLDKELEKAPAEAQSNPIFKSLLTTWKGIDAAIVTADWKDEGEVRVIVQPADKLSDTAKRWFTEKPAIAEVWKRLPEDSIFAAGGTLDFAEAIRNLASIVPDKDAGDAKDALQRQLGAVLGLDIFKEIMPVLGPDLGIAVFAAKDPKLPPQGLFALHVNKGKGESSVDQAMVKSMQVMVGFALLDWNRKQRPPIRLKTSKQEGATIHYLSHEKLFPPGFQPAFGLKDGYLIFATAPEAFGRFRVTASEASTEAPIMRFSSVGAADLLKNQRETAIATLVDRQKLSKEVAAGKIDAAEATLRLFERITLQQGLEDGQMVWTLRLVPRK